MVKLLEFSIKIEEFPSNGGIFLSVGNFPVLEKFLSNGEFAMTSSVISEFPRFVTKRINALLEGNCQNPTQP